MNFEDITISCIDEESPIKNDCGDLFDVVIKLSASAPEKWAFDFNETWCSNTYKNYRRATAAGQHITIPCLLGEFKKDHLPQIERIIKQTNDAYRKLGNRGQRNREHS